MSRTWSKSVALLVAALASGACTAQGPLASPEPSAGVAVNTSATPSIAPTAVPSAATSFISDCRTSMLRVSLVKTSAGLGAVGGYLAFTNIGPGPCSLTGWPTIVGEPTTGDQPPDRDVTATLDFPPIAGTPIVVLRPGEAAVAAFAAGDNPGGPSSTCPPPYLTLKVTPPGNESSVALSAWIPYAGAYMPSCTAIEITKVVSASMAGIDVPANLPSPGSS